MKNILLFPIIILITLYCLVEILVYGHLLSKEEVVMYVKNSVSVFEERFLILFGGILWILILTYVLHQ